MMFFTWKKRKLNVAGLAIIICPGGIRGQQGVAWPWMGAALAKTRDLVLGTGVTAPILRYHPAIVAQVFATLAGMFPNRIILGLGRGEALNEVTSGNIWPNNSERFAMLREAIKLIKKLWKEEWVTFRGEYYWVKDSRLYTKPNDPIPVYIAASEKQSALLAGEEGDGLITTESNVEKIRNNLIPAFEKGERKNELVHEARSKEYYSFLHHMTKTKKNHFNQFDFGEAP